MQVLAIGGSASAGKTTLAATLTQRLGVGAVIHVDDLRVALEAADGPSFIAATEDVWRRPVPWLCQQLKAETRRVHPVIAAEIDLVLASGSRAIIEGEGVEPLLLERWPRAVVRAVYVIETDAARLHERFAGRMSGARFLALSREEQKSVVEMNRRYGEWLRLQAERYGQAWVASEPWATLADRVQVATA